MARTVEELVIKLKHSDAYSAGLKSMVNKYKGAGLAMAGALAVAGVAILKITKRTAELGDKFQKMSIRTGVATQTLSEMAHVAELSGTSIEVVENSILKMAKAVNDANNGLSTQERTFEKLGIKIKNTNGTLKDTDTLFFEVLEGLRSVTSQTERAALAQEAFGRSGTKLLTIVNESADSVERLRKEARELGITFDQQAANDAARMNDELDRMNKSVTGLTNELGKTLIPLIADWAQAWTDGMQKIKASFSDNTEAQTRSIKELQASRIKELDAIDRWKKRIEELSFYQIGQIAAAESEIDRKQKLVDVYNSQIRAAFELKRAEEALAEKEQKKEPSRDQIDSEISDLEKFVELEYQTEITRNENLAETSLWRQQLRDEERADKISKAEEDAAREKKLHKLRVQGAQTTASALVSIGESLNQLSSGQHREMFEFLKIARAGETIVNTYAAASNALVTVPYPYNFVAAATVIAAGLANLAVINSTQFGATSAGGGGVPAAPVITQPDETGVSGDQGEGQGQGLIINIYNPMGTEDWDKLTEEEIAPALRRGTGRNVQIT